MTLLRHRRHLHHLPRHHHRRRHRRPESLNMYMIRSKKFVQSEENFISESTFDLITLQIQIMGGKTNVCCLVTGC